MNPVEIFVTLSRKGWCIEQLDHATGRKLQAVVPPEHEDFAHRIHDALVTEQERLDTLAALRSQLEIQRAQINRLMDARDAEIGMKNELSKMLESIVEAGHFELDHNGQLPFDIQEVQAAIAKAKGTK